MATPNNVTPTNCSWWPISAVDNDAGKSKEAEENQDLTDPALRSKDRLVLYHWTQSFSSQKVNALLDSQERITSSIQGIRLPRENGLLIEEETGCFTGMERGAAGKENV